MRTKRIAKTLCCIVGIFACATFSPAHADDKKINLELDVLQYLYDKSDLIVVGKFTREPSGFYMRRRVHGLGGFQVEDVLKGDSKLKGQNIGVGFVRVALGDEKEEHTLYRKDAECILFLKYEEQPGNPTPEMIDGLKSLREELKRLGIDEREIPEKLIKWIVVDQWIGAQHRDTTMERVLKGRSEKK